MMVQAVRRGESVRSVARRYAMSPATVLKWVSRGEGRRLDRVNFADRPRGAKVVWNRTPVTADVLGHRIPVDPLWSHRLLRCEVHLDRESIQCFALRRSDPTDQPLLNQIHYRIPKRPFRGKP